jgi:hypothetical protein
MALSVCGDFGRVASGRKGNRCGLDPCFTSSPLASLPVANETPRQFLRIVSSGVYGREPYFTENPLLAGYLCGILQNVVA